MRHNLLVSTYSLSCIIVVIGLGFNAFIYTLPTLDKIFIASSLMVLIPTLMGRIYIRANKLAN